MLTLVICCWSILFGNITCWYYQYCLLCRVCKMRNGLFIVRQYWKWRLPPLPLHSYVYISYQAKHPLNLSNKRRKSANISEIQDIPNLIRCWYCTKYLLDTFSLQAHCLLPSYPSIWERDMHLEGPHTTLCSGTSTGTSISKCYWHPSTHSRGNVCRSKTH